MVRETEQDLTDPGNLPSGPPEETKISRRQVLKYGVAATGALAGAGAFLHYLLKPAAAAVEIEGAGIFKNDAPGSELWRLWQERGWVKEAYHYLKLGRNVQCRICPNHCLLAPGDRSHCRDKVNRDGVLYTLAYANPCALHVDPIEKKPLFHFLPGSQSFSLATAGCVFRCLNCQNWDISQRKPEDVKDASGPEFRLTAQALQSSGQGPMDRLSLFPADVAELAQMKNCASIAYTYSEPIAYYEYAYDTCKLARSKGVKNVLVTCGSIEEEALRDLGQYLDGVHVDLKGYDESTYRKLNSGSLQPILNTLKTLKSMGVWFEVVNLVVPTYTDNLDVIKGMCGWMVQNLGPDYPVHFSRFIPMHKLTYLSPTPADILIKAREAAMSIGLHYVYIGNLPGVIEAQATYCPSCRRAVVERDVFAVTGMNLQDGACRFCQTRIPGVWSA